MLLDVLDRGLDEDRLIADHLRVNIGRQGLGDFVQPLLHFVGGGHGVLAALLGDDQGDRRHAIEPGGGARLFVAVLGVRRYRPPSPHSRCELAMVIWLNCVGIHDAAGGAHA